MAVHDAILEDLVNPAEIVGKRIRIKLDGSRIMKVHLDKAQQTNIEHKVSFKPTIPKIKLGTPLYLGNVISYSEQKFESSFADNDATALVL